LSTEIIANFHLSYFVGMYDWNNVPSTQAKSMRDTKPRTMSLLSLDIEEEGTLHANVLLAKLLA